jgi:hypothetical protein
MMMRKFCWFVSDGDFLLGGCAFWLFLAGATERGNWNIAAKGETGPGRIVPFTTVDKGPSTKDNCSPYLLRSNYSCWFSR